MNNYLFDRLKQEQKYSINDFVLKAAAKALNKVPKVNSQFHETFVRQFKQVDISIAVATEHGLITPILRNVNNLSIGQISQQTKEIVAQAKERRVRPEDYEGGTFTVSNLGMFGVKTFSAIINPPQCAILAVGEVSKDHSLIVTLSCDHRIIDGATGAEWLKEFKKNLEDPSQLIKQ